MDQTKTLGKWQRHVIMTCAGILTGYVLTAPSIFKSQLIALIQYFGLRLFLSVRIIR